MKTYTIILTLLISGFLAACSSNHKTETADTAAATDSVKTAEFKNDTIAQVYTHYIKLKDALVKSDVKAADSAASELAIALHTIKGCENTAQNAIEIGKSTDIKDQRSKFISLSSDVIAMFKNTDLLSGSVFVEFCPMANNGKGAYWLASNKEIRNPYYGDEMLDCGEVKQEIK
ncbi:MAG TPA: hypothetical protein DIT07_09905 [Sphingobacteriaceae bacterium]|nr:hypothetical protein [Sphingobacteriaceae bacterium]